MSKQKKKEHCLTIKIFFFFRVSPLGYSSSPGRGVCTLQRSSSHMCKPPPPPPIRRTSSISSQNGDSVGPSLSRTSSFKGGTSPMSGVPRVEDDGEDATPHGSVENIPPMPVDQEQHASMDAMAAANCKTDTLRRLQSSPGILRRSTSMSQRDSSTAGGSPMHGSSGSRQQSLFERDPHLRRSLTITSQAERANVLQRINGGSPTKNSVSFAPTVATCPDGSAYKRISTHHVIPVSGGAAVTQLPPVSSSSQQKDKLSPEGEIYGFGKKFKENSRHYFNGEPSNIPSSSNLMGFSYPTTGAPMSQEAIQNQMFLDSLSAKLTGSVQQGSRLNSAQQQQQQQLGPAVNSISSSSQQHHQPQMTSEANFGSSPKSQLNAQIENGAFQLKKTSTVNDRSAPRI